MDTIRRGNAAEAAVIHRLARAGIGVALPFGGGWAYDIVAEVPPDARLLRVQVKSGRVRKGCVRFNTYSTDHGSGPRRYDGRADVIAVYVQELDDVFVIPVAECPSSEGYLRLDVPRNNQGRRVRFAAEYEFDTWVRGLAWPTALDRAA